MASADERRRQKRQEKQRLRAKERAAEARTRRQASKTRSPDRLGDLPLGECFISNHWHERGAKIHAAVTRKHPNGKVAVALFSIDLSGRGALKAEIQPDLREEQVLGLLGQRSEGGETIQACEPELAALAVVTAAELAESAGKGLPKGWDAAAELLGDIDPYDCPHELLVGPPDAPVSRERKGLLESVKGWFGRRPPDPDGE